jgi:hypothetical protein
MFNCDCRWTETVIGLVILIATLWPGILGSASWWVVVIAAIVLVLHSWTCKSCGVKMTGSMPPSRKKRR